MYKKQQYITIQPYNNIAIKLSAYIKKIVKKKSLHVLLPILYTCRLEY